MGRECNWEQDLVGVLEAQEKVKRLRLIQQLDAKYLACIVRDRIRAVGCEGIRYAGLAQVLKIQRENDSTIR